MVVVVVVLVDVLVVARNMDMRVKRIINVMAILGVIMEEITVLSILILNLGGILNREDKEEVEKSLTIDGALPCRLDYNDSSSQKGWIEEETSCV